MKDKEVRAVRTCFCTNTVPVVPPTQIANVYIIYIYIRYLRLGYSKQECFTVSN